MGNHINLPTENNSGVSTIARMLREDEHACIEDVLDALWLASLFPASVDEVNLSSSTHQNNTTDNLLGIPPTFSTPDNEPNTANSSNIIGETSISTQSLNREKRLYPDTLDTELSQSKGEIPVIRFRSPSAPALPNRRAIARALRPFTKKIKSHTRSQISEDLTIRQAAETQTMIPVMEAALERWLDICIVMHSSPSMVIWEKTIEEFKRVLEGVGAFRSVQTWNAKFIDGGCVLHLGTNINAGNAANVSPRHLIDTTGHRVILVVSDCIEPYWSNDEFGYWALQWGKHNCVALVNVLPKNYWAQTELGSLFVLPTDGKVAVPYTAAPNSALLYMQRRRKKISNERKPNLVPVVNLEPQALITWAKCLVGGDSLPMTGYEFPAPIKQPIADQNIGDSQAEDEAIELLSESMVRDILASLSVNAQRLVRHLSSVPLTLPIIRLVQELFLPQSNLVDLAEVLLSGLIYRTTPKLANVSSDHIGFDFVPGARKSILSTIDREYGFSVIDLVLQRLRGFVNLKFGIGSGFEALLEDPEGKSEWKIASEVVRSFASIRDEVLAYLDPSFKLPINSQITQADLASIKTKRAARNEIENVHQNRQAPQKSLQTDRVAVHKDEPKESPKSYDVFLSHNERDKAMVRQIAGKLEARGIHCFLDQNKILPGEEFQLELAIAMRNSQACIIFFGPHGVSAWHEEEAKLAGRRRARDKDFRVIIAFLPGSSRADLDNNAAFDLLAGNSFHEFGNIDDVAALDRLVEGLSNTNKSHAANDSRTFSREPVYVQNNQVSVDARPRPTSSAGITYPEAVQSYCNRILEDPRLHRYRVDQRFVRMRVLLNQMEQAETRFQPNNGNALEAGDLIEAIDQLHTTGVGAAAVLVLGEPGAGKSMLLRHLQTVRTQQQLSTAQPASPHIPFFVALNGYHADSPPPVEWLAELWRDEAFDLPDFDSMRHKGRILLLCDALNEMWHRGDLNERIRLWRDFLPGWVRDGNHAVFTCRSMDIGIGLSSPILTVPQIYVQPLNNAQIQAFLNAYIPEQAETIYAALERDPHQRSFYGSPFFLNLLIQQVGFGGSIAHNRATLFSGFIRTALKREVEAEQALFIGSAEKALLLEEDVKWLTTQSSSSTSFELPEFGPLIPKLCALAFELQKQQTQTNTALTISQENPVMILLSEALKLIDHPRGRDIIAAGIRLSLLDEVRASRSISIRFHHRLFQEYFAARVVADRPDSQLAAVTWLERDISPTIAEVLTTLGKAESLPDLPSTGWEATMQLAVTMSSNPEAFIRQLMPVNLPLAGRCAYALGVNASWALKTELKSALVARSRDRYTDLRVRVDAMLALGPLGDPRFAQFSSPYGNYLLPPMIEIPAGRYRVGDDESENANQRPEQDVDIAAFAIAQFSVTNAEYALFMQAGGYDDLRWWQSATALAWLNGSGIAENMRQSRLNDRARALGWSEEYLQQLGSEGQIDSDYWLLLRKMSDEEFETWVIKQTSDMIVYRLPRFWRDGTANAPLQPVVGITWYEARAYCAWLTAQTGQLYRLPTEAELEVAISGPERNRYAYGNFVDPLRGNTLETHLMRSTPIGIFPDGDTPTGISDLCGNTFDWTLSPETKHLDLTVDLALDDPQYKRVLRGGAWFFNQKLARATYRFGLHPADGNNPYAGFRLVKTNNNQ